jgi:NAD(P)H-flavin reductase
MFPLIRNEVLALQVHRLVIRAPLIARSCQPGQFAILRVDHGYERVPVMITDADGEEGTITLIIQAVGEAAQAIVASKPGDSFQEIEGPLSMPVQVRTSRP